MPVNLENLEDLSEPQVAARLAELTELVEGLGAGASVRRGFIRDFVLRLHAILGQAYSDRLDVVGRSLNPLLPISGEIDADILSQVAATYGVSRTQDAIARGQLRVELNRNRAVLVPGGTLLATVDGKRYATSQTFAARASATEIRDASDRQLSLNADGNYEFYIDVSAVLPGAGGNIVAGEELSFVATSVPNVVRISAAANFSGGLSAETDQQLIARIRRQLPAKTFSTRLSVAATITSQPSLSQTLAVSTIGYGDIEMVRSRRVGMDGRSADVYLRTAEMPLTTILAGVATAVAEVAPGRLRWRVLLDRDTAAGIYRVLGVRGAAIGDLNAVGVSRGFDASPIQNELTPRLSNAIDAAFSRYQTITIVGEAAAGQYAVGDSVDVEVGVVYMPGIVDAQAVASSRKHRFVGGDTLIRAAIPTYLAVGIDVHARRDVSLPDPQVIKAAVAAMINTSGFAGRLQTSRIASIVHEFMPRDVDVASVSVIAETILPTGQIHRSRTSSYIDVPNMPEIAVSPRTAVFFCDPSSVVINAYATTLSTIV
jgi:hypothetical protein